MTAHTNHVNYRTVTDDRPTVGGATSTVTTAAGQPKTPNRRRKPGWVAPAGIAIGAVLVVGAGVLLVDAITEPSPSTVTEFGTSQRLVQESIDEALAERSAVESPSTGTPAQLADAAVAEVLGSGTSQRRVQDSIDEALARNGTFTPIVFQGTSQPLIQDAIDEALAQNASR